MIYVVGNAVYTLPDYTSESSLNDSINKGDFASSYVTISDFLMFLEREIKSCNFLIRVHMNSDSEILLKYKLLELNFLYDKFFALLKKKFKE